MRKYSALILTAILAAGCANEFENAFDDRGGTAIELSSVSTEMTRAVISGTAFTTEEANAGIGLFFLDKEGKAYGTNKSNVRYGYNDGKWTAGDPLYIGGEDGVLYGYYPYAEGITDLTSIPVASSVNGTDWLYATPVTVTPADAGNVSLMLSHALARVTISFRCASDYIGSGKLSEISLLGDCISASGSLDATDGSIKAAASGFTAGIEQILSKGASTTVECLVIPVASSESDVPDVKVGCVIDGRYYEATFSGANAVQILKGVQTKLSLTVSNTSLTIDGTSIGWWGEGGSQEISVGGDHTVTVKLHSGTPASDVLLTYGLDESGNAVEIKSYSVTGREIVCILDDGQSIQPVVDGNLRKFTIPEITRDITATLSYRYDLKVFVTPSYAGSLSGYSSSNNPGAEISLTTTAAGNSVFNGWTDIYGNSLTDGDTPTYTFSIESDTVLVADYDVEYGSDVLSGVFTVASDNGYGKPKRVRFSKGNLCWESTGRGSFSFWPVQTFSPDSWSSDTASLFFWRTTNYLTATSWENPDATFAPYDDYYTEEPEIGSNDVFFTNTPDFSVNGVSAWYTLSSEEWYYLCYGRSNAITERFTKFRSGVTISDEGCDICGYVLAPDNFSGTIPESFTYSEWRKAESDYGLVFLPAAGYRQGIDIMNYNTVGYYWTSSLYEEGPGFAYFPGNSLKLYSSMPRSNGISVRLVSDCK